MRPMAVLILLVFSSTACAQAAVMKSEASATVPGTGSKESERSAASLEPSVGRFQLVGVPGHPGSPFLLDTKTGCVWHQVQNQETKRTTFVEVDVENLHWSWGSGAQQLLAQRVDNSNLTDEQKRTMKQALRQTACGLTNVVLTPGQAAQGTPP